MAKSRHPNKEIEAAVAYALARGWTLVAAHGHAWGILRCPHGQRGGCAISVHSTPRVPQNHADQVRRNVDRCPH
jgi:hypothetical protein